MKSMVILGIILIVALMTGTYLALGNSFSFGKDSTNDLTMLAVLLLLVIVVFVVLKYVNQIKHDKATGEVSEENWDGIGEYKNPIPVGWGLAFIVSIIWMIWYITLGYPLDAFSQIGQYNQETITYNKKFEHKWKNLDEQTLKSMGESVFLVQCTPCHGEDAEGINGKAQNLTHRISKASIVDMIKHGGNNFKDKFPAGMPPMLLSDATQIDTVATYVAGGLKGKAPASWAVCSSCHGVNGKGMPFVAPDLRNYSDAFVTTVLNDGKKGEIGIMPSFKDRLNPIQMKALAHYIRTLGE